MCLVHSTLCAFQSHAKKVVLQPGWYIKAPTRGGGSFYRFPCAIEEEGQDSLPFLVISEDSLPYTRWTVIFDEVINGTFDDESGVAQFIREEMTRSIDQKAQVQTPFKRPRFGRNTFKLDTLDDGEVDEQ